MVFFFEKFRFEQLFGSVQEFVVLGPGAFSFAFVFFTEQIGIHQVVQFQFWKFWLILLVQTFQASAPPSVAPTQTPSFAFLRDATANRAKEQSAQTYRNAAAAAAVGAAGAVAVHEATKARPAPTPPSSTSNVARAPAPPPAPTPTPTPTRSGPGLGDIMTGVLIGNAISNHGRAQERSPAPSSGSYSTPVPVDPDSELGRAAQRGTRPFPPPMVAPPARLPPISETE